MIPNDQDCIFCQIIRGTAAASIVFRDDIVIAFLDIQPVNPGQVLIIPMRHAADLSELDPSTSGRMFEIAQKLAAALRSSGIPCEGVNLFLADGAVAMQEVFHVHLHVIPRFEGDGFGLKYGPSNFVHLPREQLDEAAAAIRAAIDGGNP
jgi:histidine triad (HIT) family protein